MTLNTVASCIAVRASHLLPAIASGGLPSGLLCKH